ncbi:MAG: enoyl-ACP reductase FabI [Acidimicrobiales bacterium]
MGILDGKRILVTGVLTDDSLAFGAARLAQEQGAEVALTGFGRGLSLTNRAARKLPAPVEVYELDVTVEEQANRVASELSERWGGLDGVVHAIGYAPDSCLGNGVLVSGWSDVATAVEVSTYSLKVLAAAFAPLLAKGGGGSIVGFDFDATVAWPGYDWMGVAKAALESLARYLARDLGPRGIRVNLIAAGPISTVAARSIPSFERFESVWNTRAPLGWDVRDSEAVARACVALLSDWFPRTTGEIIHVDGGFHATGV